MIQPRETIDRMPPYEPPRAGRRGTTRLDFNERTDGAAGPPLAALGAMTAEDLQAYPDIEPALRAAEAFYRVPEGRLAMTNGADEAIRALCTAYIDPGQAVVIPAPSFAMFAVNARIAGARIVEVPYRTDMAFPDSELLGALPGARMLILASPNNPTATEISGEVLTKLLKAAPDTLVVVDEAYAEFAGDSFLGLAARHDNLVVLRTLSKAWGVAGLRAGFLAAHPRVVAAVNKVLPPYGVNAAAVMAACACFGNRDYLDRYVREVTESRKLLLNGLTRLGVTWFPTRANFVLTALGAKAGPVVEALTHRGIRLRPRPEVAGHDGCVRITVGTKEQTEQLLRALGEALNARRTD